MKNILKKLWLLHFPVNITYFKAELVLQELFSIFQCGISALMVLNYSVKMSNDSIETKMTLEYKTFFVNTVNSAVGMGDSYQILNSV